MPSHVLLLAHIAFSKPTSFRIATNLLLFAISTPSHAIVPYATRYPSQLPVFVAFVYLSSCVLTSLLQLSCINSLLKDTANSSSPLVLSHGWEETLSRPVRGSPCSRLCSGYRLLDHCYWNCYARLYILARLHYSSRNFSLQSRPKLLPGLPQCQVCIYTLTTIPTNK